MGSEDDERALLEANILQVLPLPMFLLAYSVC